MKISCPHCGHELNASGAAIGAEVRCPVCRLQVGLTGASGDSSRSETPPRVERGEKPAFAPSTRRFGIPGWTWLILGSALLGLFAVPVAWRVSRSFRVVRAQREASEVAATAQQWLQAKEPGPSAELEEKLTAVLEHPFVEEATKRHIRQLFRQISARNAARNAAAVWERAMSAKRSGNLDEAERGLNEYLQHAKAELQAKTDAKRLLDEIALLRSDERQRKLLTNLSDGEFAKVRRGGLWPVGVLPTDPDLTKMFLDAVQTLVRQESERRQPSENMLRKDQRVKNSGLGVKWRGRVESIEEEGNAYNVRIEEVLAEGVPFRKGEIQTVDKAELQAEDPTPQP